MESTMNEEKLILLGIEKEIDKRLVQLSAKLKIYKCTKEDKDRSEIFDLLNLIVSLDDKKNEMRKFC